jgi:tartrate dehydrogenase/decarboxylase/D-malate dehydrogenase
MAAIWAASLMLEQLGEQEAAALVMRGLEHVALEGPRTKDLGGQASTVDIGTAVVSAITGS